MPTRAVEVSEEEAAAREAIGQAREEGRTIPSPAVVVMTGESLMKVQELAELCGIEEQEVVALALQDLYLKVKQRATTDRNPGNETKDADPTSGDQDPFRAF